MAHTSQLESLAYSGPVLLEDYHLLEKIGQVMLLTCTGSDMGYMCVIFPDLWKPRSIEN